MHAELLKVKDIEMLCTFSPPNTFPAVAILQLQPQFTKICF